jgi:hypothetical protein
MREQGDRTVATLSNGVTLSAIELECPFANTSTGPVGVGF